MVRLPEGDGRPDRSRFRHTLVLVATLTPMLFLTDRSRTSESPKIVATCALIGVLVGLGLGVYADQVDPRDADDVTVTVLAVVAGALLAGIGWWFLTVSQFVVLVSAFGWSLVGTYGVRYALWRISGKNVAT